MTTINTTRRVVNTNTPNRLPNVTPTIFLLLIPIPVQWHITESTNLKIN